MSMTNNNPSGINGSGKKNYPPDDVLSAALHQYAKEELSVHERLERLRTEHNLCIKKSRLAELNKKFCVPNVRSRKPREIIATQAVLDKIADDTRQANGVGTLKTLLANEGTPLPRDFIRSVLRTHAPEGLSKRFPGANKIMRSALVALGPNHQHHADGHEKLNAQGLGIGGVGLNIYGIKDQWSSFLLHLVVVPNNRLETTIGHVYLDCVEKYRFIPITFVVDKGSETGLLRAFQTGIREAYASEIGEEIKAVEQVKSVHNTPIEGLWHWFLQTFGLNIRDVIRQGYIDGVFRPESDLHELLFYWLWPQILQAQLERFVEYWNNHKIRRQSKKPNMSGFTPRHGFTVPAYPAQDCKINVDQPVVDALRDQITVSREEAMRWVPDDFAQKAVQAYDALGRPSLGNVQSGWDIFRSMVLILNRG